MPLWGGTDATANSPISAPAQLRLAPNTANRDALYGNTTGDAFTTGQTVGMFGAAVGELAGRAGVASITITAAGTGYTDRPTVAIAAFDDATGVNATATATGGVVLFTVVGPGTGGSAIPGDNLTIADGTGTAAVANVTSTELRTVAISVAGSGYANGDVVTLTTGTGTAATFTVTTGAADTIPASLALTTRGTYTVNPTLTATATTVLPAGGTGLTVTSTTRIKTVAVKTAGAYTVLPDLTANAPTGGGATGVTLDLAIGVSTITVTAIGSGYLTVPAVTFGGAGGTGSTGTAVMQGAGAGGITHAGWQLRTEGSGGRAGRVHYETLVAMRSLSGDATDDTQLPE